MLPVLRSYERLSPELVLLVQSHNPNNPDTVTSDYLVTGARGWDWLNQLYPAARILDYDNFNDQGKPEFKVAADELVDYPTIIRVMYAVLDGVDTALFVVTELGDDAGKIVSNIEKLLEKKNVTDKRVLEITIPDDCENPDQYVRRLMDEFMTLNNLPVEKVALRLSVMSAHRDPATGKPTGLSYIDELPWVPNYLQDVNVEGAYPKINADTPDEALAQSATALRGCTGQMLVADDSPYLNEGKEDVADLTKAPKVDITIKDTDIVVVDMVKEYTPLIRKWAEDRNIIGGGSSTLDQFIKGLTEAGELWTHIGKGQRELLKDDIGDVYVCLVNAAGNLGINLEDHVRPLEAFHHHAGRALYARRGLKRYSLQVLYTLAAASQAIENILDSDNERDVYFFKTDFADACADVVYALETIALEQKWSLTDCVIAAYEDIKDRKGLMVDGTFVKEKDFTVEMVSAALNDDRVKPETKVYLREWCLQQLSDQTQEMDAHDKLNASEGGLLGTSAFWKTWAAACGGVEEYKMTEATIALLNACTGNQFVATIGVFGKPNINGDVFVIDETKLNVAMSGMVGKLVGEIESPEPIKATDLNEWLVRMHTVVESNATGTLVAYAINNLGDGEHGPILEVVGLIEPSELLKARSSGGVAGHFGIRSIVTVRTDAPTVKHVEDLIGFDLHANNPRV
jgi:hypothetical protein